MDDHYLNLEPRFQTVDFVGNLELIIFDIASERKRKNKEAADAHQAKYIRREVVEVQRGRER